jgi:hypothetical protein
VGAGSVLFGLAYAGRLLSGMDALDLFSVLLDSTMICAALLFIVGLRSFIGEAVPSFRRLLGFVMDYAVLEYLLMAVAGVPGRHVLLNLVLSVLYAVTAAVSGKQVGLQPPGQRAPLMCLALFLGGLSLMTLGRTYLIARDGSYAIFGGLYAQVFYGYASVTAVVLALILIWMVLVSNCVQSQAAFVV